MDLSQYASMDDAYSVQNILRVTQQVPTNPNFADYQVNATVVDENGNEYQFSHAHSDDLRHGRHLPRFAGDCPRPGSTIDPNTGECTDMCRTDRDCPLSYQCGQTSNGSRCLRQTCTSDSQCDSGVCAPDQGRTEKVCQPLVCTNDTPMLTNYWVSDGVHNALEHYDYSNTPCISTSHYHLRGRVVPDVSNDPRYSDMY